jgi:hypothetical protein
MNGNNHVLEWWKSKSQYGKRGAIYPSRPYLPTCLPHAAESRSLAASVVFNEMKNTRLQDPRPRPKTLP